MDVASLRKQIPACQRTIYMNTGWSGPSPRCVVEAIKERLEYESYEGPTSRAMLDSSQEVRQQAREAVAHLLNVSPEEVCLTESTTEGLNIVVNGLPWREEDEIVTFGLEHSSVLIPSFYLQKRHGVRVKVLTIAPNQDHDTILARVEDALTDRTRLVFLSHIQFSSGLRMPVEGIRELTRDRGILMLLDGAQTAGHIALDLRALGCDFYSIPGQKWLLGPDGVGALYICHDLIPHLAPMKVSGRAVTSHDEAGNFEPDTPSIDKFQLTTTSVPLRAGLVEAIRFTQEVGIEEVEGRCLALASYLKGALLETPGVTLLSPLEGPGSSGLVSFSIEGVEPQDAVAYLWEQHRVVARSVRNPSCIRLSLDFFNTEEEADQAVAAVRHLAG